MPRATSQNLNSDVLRYNCAHVSEYGMRCLQYIQLALLKGGVFPPVLFDAIHFMLPTLTNHKSFFILKEISVSSKVT